jgi:hypothetical protein
MTLVLSIVGAGAGLVVGDGDSLSPLEHPFVLFLAGDVWRHASLVQGAMIKARAGLVGAGWVWV